MKDVFYFKVLKEKQSLYICVGFFHELWKTDSIHLWKYFIIDRIEMITDSRVSNARRRIIRIREP